MFKHHTILALCLLCSAMTIPGCDSDPSDTDATETETTTESDTDESDTDTETPDAGVTHGDSEDWHDDIRDSPHCLQQPCADE